MLDIVFPKIHSEGYKFLAIAILITIILYFFSGLTYFSSILKGRVKTFLMIEPMISSCVTFGSIWGIRFISPIFGIIAMVSGILIYVSFYVIVIALLAESIPKK